MSSVFDYIFNIGGNFEAKISGITKATGGFSATVESAQSKLGGFTTALARFDLAKNAVQGIVDGFTQIGSSGVALDSQMHDLSAVAGVTGETLKQIEGFARDSAKAFGTDASVAVEGYKLLLSQLSPELGKYPDVLRTMGDCIQTTSKLMGGDGVAAAQVLTTAMNQYGVSLEDPTRASEEMARMMNVMAAAGQAGSQSFRPFRQLYSSAVWPRKPPTSVLRKPTPQSRYLTKRARKRARAVLPFVMFWDNSAKVVS